MAVTAMAALAQKNPLTLELPGFTAVSEAQLYHGIELPGFFSLNVQRNGRLVQTCHLNRELPLVLSLIDQNRDTYISQNSFVKASREAVHLLCISGSFVDLDLRLSDPDAATLIRSYPEPKDFANAIVKYCGEKLIPLPSLIIHSGRGLQLKWLYSRAIPRAARPRWDALQAVIVASFARFLADAKARDVSRILRVVGTMNTKAIAEGWAHPQVDVVWTNPGWDGDCIRDGVKHYDFDDLCRMLLPLDRPGETWRSTEDGKRYLRAKRWEKTDHIKPSNWKEWAADHVTKLAGREIAWSQLAIVRQTLKMRYGVGGVPEGKRNDFLWIMANCLAWSTPDDQTWHSGLSELAMEVSPTLSPKEIKESTCSVKKRLDEEWKALSLGVAPGWGHGLYKLSHDTLVKTLCMNAEEKAAADSLMHQQFAKVQQRRGKKSGRVRAKKYEDKRLQARLLAKEGQSARAIASALQVSYDTVRNWLKTSCQSHNE